MAEQIHVRLEDSPAEALTEYTETSEKSEKKFIVNKSVRSSSTK